MLDSFIDILTALFIFLVPILGFCSLGYLLYRGLNLLLQSKKVLQIFGVLLFACTIAIYIAISFVCIKDIYYMILMPEKTSLLNLKSFFLGILYIIFFTELSIRGMVGKSIISAIDNREKWTDPFLILFFLFLMIGMTYTLTMMLGKIYYLNTQENLRLDIIWFLLNSYGISKFTLFSIRKLGI